MPARRGGHAVAVTLAALGLLMPAADALSTTQASAVGTGSVATGTWSAVATSATAAPWPTGPLTLTVRKSTPAYFRVVNTGTLPLVSAIYAVTASTPTSLETCDLAWNEKSGRCPGTVTAVPTGTPTPVVPVSAGDVLHLRATNASNQFVTTTVEVVVPRFGARPPLDSSS